MNETPEGIQNLMNKKYEIHRVTGVNLELQIQKLKISQPEIDKEYIITIEEVNNVK